MKSKNYKTCKINKIISYCSTLIIYLLKKKLLGLFLEPKQSIRTSLYDTHYASLSLLIIIIIITHLYDAWGRLVNPPRYSSINDPRHFIFFLVYGQSTKLSNQTRLWKKASTNYGPIINLMMKLTNLNPDFSI